MEEGYDLDMEEEEEEDTQGLMELDESVVNTLRLYYLTKEEGARALMDCNVVQAVETEGSKV